MPFAFEPELESFLRRMPKTETHLHLEGALPWAFIQKIDAEKYADFPESWANDFKYRDFAHFEEHLLGLAFQWYRSPEHYQAAAQVVFAKLVDDGVRYLETSFASGVVEFLGLDGRAICQAIRAACPPELELRIFLGIHHSGFTPQMLPVIEEACHWPELDGLDLHGVETLPVDPVAPQIWQQAREAGKFTKAHAGEFRGPDFIRYAVDELGVDRIEHGIRAVEDEVLVKTLAESGVTLDICPISNHKLVPGIRLENHPIRKLFDAGVQVTVSTDDPLTFGNTILEDYGVLQTHLDFTDDELKQLARYGFEAALVDDDTRQTWLQELASA